MTDLRVALLGYGHWGPNLARNLHRQLGTGWTACADVNPQRLAEVKFLYPWVSALTDAGPVLADDTVDAVVIATPARTHAPLVAEALGAGKHVLVEKPLALSTEDAVRLTRQAERAGRVLMVGHTFEYNPAVLKMRELVASGSLGELCYLHSQRVNLGRIQSDINAMWSIGPHDVSIANFLTGSRPRWVAAKGARYLHAEVEDVVFATIGYDGGVLAHLHVSWLDPSKVRRTTVVGSKRMIVYDDLDSEATLRVYDKSAERVEGGYGEFQFRLRTGDLHVPKIDLAEPLAGELAHFLECVATGATPNSDGWNGVRVVAALEAADRSLRRGGIPVDVSMPT
ncbi:MAG TPA: Gfo/Idh/MocA family oxidoreductase [Actinomycetes bacterium]|nr:Gfo/Idh/MocA family oxidoreductase [Actinomycetes bacterium]